MACHWHWTRDGIGIRTGNTNGTPPLTADPPLKSAPSLTHSFSPPLSFQLTTVAPYSSTAMLSPVGRVAVTRPLSWVIVALAGGCAGVAERERLLGLGRVEDMTVVLGWRCGGCGYEGLIWNGLVALCRIEGES